MNTRSSFPDGFMNTRLSFPDGWRKFLSPPFGQSPDLDHIARLLKDGALDPDSTNENGQTVLSYAAENGKQGIVEVLLDHGVVDVNKADKDGQTPLFWAAEHEQEEIARLLIGRGADLDIPNVHSKTLLSSAAKRGREAIVALLLGPGTAAPDKKDKYGRTPLMYAVRGFKNFLGYREIRNSVGIVKMLLDYGADPDATDEQGRTPLSMAAERGTKEAAKHLIQKSVDGLDRKDSSGRSPLSWASGCGEKEMVELLLHEGANLDSADNKGHTPLWWAVKEGKREILKVLLKLEKANSNHQDKHGRTALSWAAEQGDDVIVKMLLANNGIKPNLADKKGRTPLAWAAEAGKENSVASLLESKDINHDPLDQDGRTPLSRASEYGHNGIISLLLKSDKVDPNCKDKRGRTPLSWAACFCSTELMPQSGQKRDRVLMSLLLENTRVNPNLQDNNWRSPLWWAVDSDQEMAVRRLLEKRTVDPAPVTRDDQTPLAHALKQGRSNIVKALAPKDLSTLHLLVEKGDLSLVESLLKFECKVNAKNNLDQTPLHVAALKGHLDIAKQLLASDRSELDHKDARGKTALGLAVQHKHPDLIEMLLEKRAQTIGIEAEEWRKAYPHKSQHVCLALLQHSDQKTSICFSDQLTDISVESEQIKRLVLFEDYTTWLSNQNPEDKHKLPSEQDHISSSEQDPISSSEQDPIPYNMRKHDKRVSVAISCLFPVVQRSPVENSFQISHLRRCGISWTVTPPAVAQAQPTWKPIECSSTLPYGWIPENDTAFLALLIRYLKEECLKICEEAEEHLRDRRSKQLEEKGNNPDFISNLAEDAQNWAELRKTPRNHIPKIRSLATMYHDSYNQDVILERLKEEMDSFDAEVNKKIDQLEKTVKDLMNLEFSWASINEAHRSTSIATSIKRLSWITFVFLPAMFASSLFGMNVDVLEKTPDWRWYILFGLGSIVVTFLVWFAIKYGQLERIMERGVRQRLQRFSNRPGAESAELAGAPIRNLEIIPDEDGGRWV